MTIRLDDLIARSGGSQLISYTFESKELRFQLFHGGEAKLLVFQLPTDTVHGRTIAPDPRRSTCRLELIDLATKLDVRDGRYIPPADPALFLEHARDRVILAYGRRASEARWLLSLQGGYVLLACLINDPGDVQWTEE